ncbi:MAG: CRISPR-associated helicase Cas3' [Verrucomicrobia bacterium]|nr:CRISPR-associated helicase Cas3' [Verrucomicrobiota bacterium]
MRGDMNSENPYFWAKTTADGQPGISVHDHCLNVGCVAEALIRALPESLRQLLPPGAPTLAALHDVGKISTGFLRKCATWLLQSNLAAAALNEFWQGAESDHAKVGQFCIQNFLKGTRTELWAVAVGAHHGRIHGHLLGQINRTAARVGWEDAARAQLVEELVCIFGRLPGRKPLTDNSDLWLLAGLIAVADWIASNERFFSASQGLPLEQARTQASVSLAAINWSGGELKLEVGFAKMFGLPGGANALQAALQVCATRTGLFIVEGPMGSGKTEAALAAAHSLIASGHNHGLYFGLPTQVTSHRIHQRVRRFLENTLADSANLRLAHSASWLDQEQALEIHPVAAGDADSAVNAADTRSWFASARHALLARYGVGTIDQALQGVVAVKHFFVRRFGLAGKVVILDEVHSYDVYTGALVTQLIRELLALRCSVIVLSATLTEARRRELLSAAGSRQEETEAAPPETLGAYPLITEAQAGQPLRSIPLSWQEDKRIQLRVGVLSEAQIVEECLRRAEAGQHVLWLRNTVVEAQAAYRAVATAARAGTVRLGLLHSRFPFFRREELEEEWLERLGKERSNDGLGSVLVATQVVEQSVDIDLDFIVSDLAPTDMLLQRMGRLWRHPRPNRPAEQPEFWINVPDLAPDASARELKSALGKSARVYAPYVLLRTAEVFHGRAMINLPLGIREILEATYAVPGEASEPAAWRELHEELLAEKLQLENEAKAAMLVLGRPSQADREEVLTRRAGAPTRQVVLLRACEPLAAGLWRLTGLEDRPVQDASGYEWRHAVARLLHRNLVRAPAYEVPSQAAPPWLSLHAGGRTAWGIIGPDGRCQFPDAAEESPLAYDDKLGLYSDSARPKQRTPDEDDEFDY